MTQDYNPESPEETGKSANEHKSQEESAILPNDGRISSGSDSSDQAPERDSPDLPPGEDDFEIVFYATIDTPQSEQFLIADEEESWADDSVKILLPAWSSTTLNTRTTAASPPPVPERSRTLSIWRGCLVGAVASVIVLSLLGSSLFSLYWFWNLRNERVDEVTAVLDAQLDQPGSGSAAENQFTYEDDRERGNPLASSFGTGASEQINRIVFVNENRHIETIAADGSDQRQLTSDAKSYLFPAWSPDGRFIAAIGGAFDGAGIYMMPDDAESAASQEVHFSEEESPFYLYWSPDGRQITFLANDRSADLSLNIVDSDGASDSRIVAVGSPMYWNWTADSRQMLVHSGSGTDDSLLVLIDDVGRPQAPLIPAPGPFQAPGISPSGRYWAYSQFQSGGTTWLVIDNRLNGKDNSRRHAGSVAFNWSPVRDELAYISGDAGNDFAYWGPLRLMDAQTGDIRLLSSDTVLAFFWSPDGDKIVTISMPESNDLGQQFEVRNEKERRLARYGPTSSMTPMAQLRQHSFQINVIDVESGEGLQLSESTLSPLFLTQFLPYFDQYALSHQIWSPDSNALVLPIVNGRQSEITVIDSRNGRMNILADGHIGFWSKQ